MRNKRRDYDVAEGIIKAAEKPEKITLYSCGDMGFIRDADEYDVKYELDRRELVAEEEKYNYVPMIDAHHWHTTEEEARACALRLLQQAKRCYREGIEGAAFFQCAAIRWHEGETQKTIADAFRRKPSQVKKIVDVQKDVIARKYGRAPRTRGDADYIDLLKKEYPEYETLPAAYREIIASGKLP